MSDSVARTIGWGCVAVLAAVAGVIIYLAVRSNVQTHANADVSLVLLADGAHVLARHDDCSDFSGLGYVKNNSCIDYMLIQTPERRSTRSFLSDEVAKLDRHNWRLFSPRDFGSRAPVIGRADLYGHDCLLLGPPNKVPVGLNNTSRQAPAFWGVLARKYAAARTHPGAILGLQLYPGPANDPYHRVC